MLFFNYCNDGKHLEGVRRSDGVIYTEDLPRNYGVIVNNNDYKGGYSLAMY